MDEKKKKLKRMATWLIAVFSTAFAIVLTVLFLVSMNNLGMAFAAGWWLVLIIGLICIAAYYIYKFLLNRKK